jgi:hypothetical protein
MIDVPGLGRRCYLAGTTLGVADPFTVPQYMTESRLLWEVSRGADAMTTLVVSSIWYVHVRDIHWDEDIKREI